MKNQGFTLIEIVVVTAIVGVVMVAILSVVTATFKSQNLSKSNSKVVNNGNWILGELRKNVLNSKSIKCISPTEVDLINSTDNKLTKITCANNSSNRVKISSLSAETIELTDDEINVISCSNFVTCTTLPSLEVGSVKFNFGIGATTAGVGATKSFSLDVTVRN